jgi:hypothetical protein
MMSAFHVLKMAGEYWGVFLVNPNDQQDKYLLTSPLDRQSDAEHFRDEFERLSTIVDIKQARFRVENSEQKRGINSTDEDDNAPLFRDS